MNVDIVRETMLLQALNDGDAFEDRGTYWIKTDHRGDDLVGVVELGSGYFREWNANTKVQHMPSLIVVNVVPFAK